MRWVASIVLLLPAIAFAHGQSKSTAECRVDGARAEVRVTLAEHDLRDGLEVLDPTRAGRLSAAELDAIGAHVRDGTRLSLGDGRACAAERVDVIPSGAPVVEVVATVALRCPEAPGDYLFELRYLPKLVPAHVTLAVITAGETRASHIFSPATPRFAGTVPRSSGGAVLGAIGGALAAAALLGWGRARRRRRGSPGM